MANRVTAGKPELAGGRHLSRLPQARHAAIMLLSAAVILLQITVTRILSVVLWYHWAFFSISLCMLGIGAPGVWFSLSPRRKGLLPWLPLAAAACVPAGIVAIVKGSKYFGPHAILFCMGCLLPAVLCLGAAVCLLLLSAEGIAIGKMYAYDLLGACSGALAVIPLMTVVPTPALAGAIGLLPLGAYLLLGGSRWIGGASAALLVAMLLWGEPFQLRHGKYYEETGRVSPIYEKWTPTARITVFDNIFFVQNPNDAFGWGMGAAPVPQTPPKQYWIEQDASAGTPITNFHGDLASLQYLLSDVATLGHQLRPPRTVAVVGAGGGRDILSALLVGATEVDAIELNAGMVAALRGPFGEFSGHVYDLPGVQTLVGEGRSVLTRSDRRYDLIQISLIDSWAATAAGAYSLAENNLYTLEAYRLYWSRLSPRGMVSTSRWMLGDRGLEVPRLLMLVKAALVAEGVAKPEAHIAIVQGGYLGTVLMSRIPFDEAELRALRYIAYRRGFVLHAPITDRAPGQQEMKQALEVGPALYRPSGFVMTPPTDDRPYFFQMLSPLRPILKGSAARAGPNAEGVTSLQTLMLVMSALTLVLFFAPFPLARWIVPQRGFWRGCLFFACLGLAFMFVEVALLQRFVLFLGHPSLATTVTLGSMLLGAGLGSLSTARLGVRGGQRWGFLLPLVVAATNLGLAPLFAASLGLVSALRVVIAVAVLVPLGFVMGIFFPLGMVRFAEHDRAWFWAINGAAGVLSTVVSLAISMEIGLSCVAYAGAAIYVVAWLLLRGRSAAS